MTALDKPTLNMLTRADLPDNSDSTRRSAFVHGVRGQETHTAVLTVCENRCKVRGKAYTETSRYFAYVNATSNVYTEVLVVKAGVAGREELRRIQAGLGRVGEVYGVIVPRTGKPTCTCVGHRAHGRCKHAESIAALLDAIVDTLHADAPERPKLLTETPYGEDLTDSSAF